jgi:beta-RFAP synthase
MTSRTITITTGARLHCGLLALGDGQQRQFGGVGLMIDRPGVSLRVTAFERDEVSADEMDRARVVEIVRQYRSRCPAGVPPPPCRIELLSSIPSHVGLGSGTQLAMAVAKGLSLFAGESDPTAAELADRVGRGKRSAIGLHGFVTGGLLVDGGKQRDDEISPIIARVDMPGDWRFVLVRPPAEIGCSGSSELGAFATLPPIPDRTTERLCRLIVLELLPSVQHRDFAGFALSLREFNHTVGQHFSSVQGGVVASRRMTELAAWLEQRGVVGVGQTSWGPTMFAACSSPEEADLWLRQIGADWSDCRVELVRPMNQGAHCRTSV